MVSSWAVVVGTNIFMVKSKDKVCRAERQPIRGNVVSLCCCSDPSVSCSVECYFGNRSEPQLWNVQLSDIWIIPFSFLTPSLWFSNLLPISNERIVTRTNFTKFFFFYFPVTALMATINKQPSERGLWCFA